MQKLNRSALILSGICIIFSLGITDTEAHNKRENTRSARRFERLWAASTTGNDWIQAYLKQHGIDWPIRSSRSSTPRSSAPSSTRSSVSSSRSSLQSSSRSSQPSSVSSSRSTSSSRSPVTSSSSSVSTQLSVIRAEIIKLVNEERAKAGRSALKEESHLHTAAQLHAEDMKNQGYFSHTGKDGRSSTQRIRDAGYPLNGSWATGENIAQGQRTATDVMEDWMNSSGHRANILSHNFEDIGVGFYQNTWVQNFASHN